MSDNGNCGCTDSSCPQRTSEVNLWDGTFTSITVPSGAGLNEVLALLESFTLTSSQCNDVKYTLNAFSSCLNLAAGSYSFTQIIDAIVTKVCSTATSLEELTTAVNNIKEQTTTVTTLADIVYPSCFLSFTGTTSTDLFNLILGKLCLILDEQGPTTGVAEPASTTPDVGAKSDSGGTNFSSYLKNSRIEHIAEVFKSFLDNHSFIYEHTSPTTSAANFVVGLKVMKGVVDDYLVIRNFTEDLTVNASKDTYFYLSGDSTVLRLEVANGAATPATPTGSHNLYKIVSNGSGVTAVTNLYTSTGITAPALGANVVNTANIVDGAVTTIKMDTVTTGVTKGHISLFLLRNDDKGRFLQLDSNLNIAGLSNNQILKYNSASNRFENADNTAVPATGVIPVSNATATDYTSSSLLETTSQVKASKKVEINTGTAEDDASATLNVVGGPVLMPRLTATEASALPLTSGYLVYVTSTNGTFTSVGFWGNIAGTWTKL